MPFELTESLWRNGDAGPMLWSLGDRATPRKLRLLAVAWTLRLWATATANETDRWVVGLAEDLADGVADPALTAFQRYADPAIVGAPGEWAVVGWHSEGRDGSTVAVMDLLHGWGDRELRKRNADLVWEHFGNPFRPVALDQSWRTEAVVALAAGIYADRAFDRLPVLADALDDAGCANPDVLAHCRSDGPHARGCWVVDLLLGKT